jgi:hypothetical protein
MNLLNYSARFRIGGNYAQTVAGKTATLDLSQAVLVWFVLLILAYG